MLTSTCRPCFQWHWNTMLKSLDKFLIRAPFPLEWGHTPSCLGLLCELLGSMEKPLALGALSEVQFLQCLPSPLELSGDKTFLTWSTLQAGELNSHWCSERLKDVSKMLPYWRTAFPVFIDLRGHLLVCWSFLFLEKTLLGSQFLHI